MSDTEHAACDFCGERDLVAVSEQGHRTARICRVCADWAIYEIRSAEVEAREQGGTRSA